MLSAITSSAITDSFTQDHHRCDRLSTQAERRVAAGDWPAAAAAVADLGAAMEHHYKEEGLLYPMADGALPQRGAAIAALLAGD